MKTNINLLESVLVEFGELGGLAEAIVEAAFGSCGVFHVHAHTRHGLLPCQLFLGSFLADFGFLHGGHSERDPQAHDEQNPD